MKYAQRLGFKTELLYESDSSISVKLSGKHVYSAFSRESGKHVIQRVPPTEKRGRRHTSVVSVAVMEIFPAADTTLDLSEVEITTQRSGGKGGQNVNKVESSVRVRHIPTGITVRIDGRDQPDNKELALHVLEKRLRDKEIAEKQERENNARRDQLGGGSRSGKVRTYSYILGKVQDHRNGKSVPIKTVMGGGFDQLK